MSAVFLSVSLSEDYSGSKGMFGLDSLKSTHWNINWCEMGLNACKRSQLDYT